MSVSRGSAGLPPCAPGAAPVASEPEPGPGETRAPGAPGASHAVLRLFAAARQAAGTGRADVAGATVGDVLGWARVTYGPAFGAVLERSRVWCNGEPAGLATPLTDGDEVAVLPPVSGGT